MNSTGQVFNSFKPAGHMVALHFFIQILSAILCSNLGQYTCGNNTEVEYLLDKKGHFNVGDV